MTKGHRERNYLLGSKVGTSVDLGRLVAEDDAHLLDYYVGRERYVSRALDWNDPATFFMGPKGIGKSAILQMVRIVKTDDSKRVIAISPDDLAFSSLAQVNPNTPVLSEATKNQWLFKSLWDFILVAEILRQELSAQNVLSSLTNLISDKYTKEARALLRISIGDERTPQPLTARILELIREVELSAECDGVKLAGKVALEKVPATAGSHLKLLAQINSVARHLADNLKHPYYILIDDLDLHWVDTPLQNEFIAALFLSLRKLRQPPRLKFIVAIREDIYHRLPLADKDKFRDAICHVEWDASHLREMLEARVHVLLSCSRSEVWGGVFPENGFDHLWDCTTGKPRELIRLASLCIDEGRRAGHKSVRDEDITKAVRRFSDERLEDLASEHRHQYPGLDRLVRRFTGWPKEFSIREMDNFVLQVAIDVDDPSKAIGPYKWAGGFVEDPTGLARALLECGILLYKASRTAVPQVFEPEKHTMSDSTWLAFHPMYSTGLGLIGA